MLEIIEVCFYDGKKLARVLTTCNRKNSMKRPNIRIKTAETVTVVAKKITTPFLLQNCNSNVIYHFSSIETLLLIGCNDMKH